MNQRPYQSDCLAATDRAFREFQRVLIVIPTGGGKTILFAWEAQRRVAAGQRVLILVHRDELARQAIDKLEKSVGIHAALEKADSYAPLDAPVVVGSVQTLCRQKRRERWPKDHFGLVVMDEAHHCVANSWQSTLAHFNAQFLGVTATPDRGDQRNLGEFFETKAYEISLKELIQQGHLARVAFKNLPLQIDLAGVECKRDAEFGQQDLDKSQLAVTLERYLPKFAECLGEHAAFRRTLVFAPLIDTSRKGMEACRAIGLNADFTFGEDPLRAEKLERFRNCEIDILWNSDLLKEGYDDPGIDGVAPFRPTRISAMYWQWIGRGTRNHPGKTNLLVLDCLYLNQQHPLAGPACLVARDEFEAEQIKEMADGGGMPSDVVQEFDLLDLQIQAENEREKSLVKRLEQVKANDAKLISPEEFAILHHSLKLAEGQDVMPSDFRPVTEKQMKWLRKVRIHPQTGNIFLRSAPAIAKPLDVAQIKTEGQASRILEVAFDSKNRGVVQASAKQKQLMRRLGAHNWDSATADDARRFFGQLRKPKQVEMV